MDSNLQKYRAFVTTVTCGSFTKAAEALGFAQSSVSKMIADLEAEWNLSLLERSRAGVQLTSDGMSMLPYARELLESYRKVQEQAAQLGGVTSGLIRIGTFSSVATHWMPNIIKNFQTDYPNIRYEMLLGDYAEIEQWVFEGRVDCGFLRLPANHDFDVVPLEKDELLLVLPPGHPLANKQRIEPSDLNGEAFLLLEHGGRTEISEYLERENIRPDIRFTTWDDYAIMAMIEQGLGIGILPRLIMKRIPYRVEVRSLHKPLYREIGLVLRNQKSTSAAVKRFLAYLPYRSVSP